jgi:zinc/manganese transport system substrate-binding protein
MSGSTEKVGNKFIVPAAIIVILLVVGVGAGLYLTRGPTSSSTSTSSAGSNTLIQVVAAENFWGSLVSQLGGTHVNVTSVV